MPQIATPQDPNRLETNTRGIVFEELYKRALLWQNHLYFGCRISATDDRHGFGKTSV
jgi:hypothetical protein